MKIAVLSVLALLVATQAAVSPAVEARFHAFIDEFGKTYRSQEEFDYRLGVFSQALTRISMENDAHVASGGDAVFGINMFSDITPKEFSHSRKGYRRDGAIPESINVTVTGNAPKTSDWRKHGYITHVKNQEQCGSCWAFSATEQIESNWIMSGKPTEVLSPQQIVSCDNNDLGCNGGDTKTAYQYVIKAGGLMSDTDYPYTSGNGNSGRCKFEKSKVVASISSWSSVSSSAKEETKMVEYLGTTGPVSVCVATNGWQDYTSGVLKNGCGGSSDVDHCVQVVGYDKNDGFYWVRNSWGVGWGYSGYIKVGMENNVCDIAGEATITKV